MKKDYSKMNFENLVKSNTELAKDHIELQLQLNAKSQELEQLREEIIRRNHGYPYFTCNPKAEKEFPIHTKIIKEHEALKTKENETI